MFIENLPAPNCKLLNDTEYFLICRFGKSLSMPRNTPSLVFLLRSFWETRPKKPPCSQIHSEIPPKIC